VLELLSECQYRVQGTAYSVQGVALAFNCCHTNMAGAKIQVKKYIPIPSISFFACNCLTHT